MKSYLYCLAQAGEMLDASGTGVSGAPVRVLNTHGFSVLLSDVDVESVPVTRENALDHARVVRSILGRTTPLPFRFGTIVTNDQLGNYLAARKAALGSKLAVVRGCIEMGVKIIWQGTEPEPPEGGRDIKRGAGTTFLAEKQRQIRGSEHQAAQADEISAWLHEAVVDLIREEHVTLNSTARLVLVAAHLVERTNIIEYRKRLTESCQKRPELHFLLSGPWPPYSFANIELEFKTQFGVS